MVYSVLCYEVVRRCEFQRRAMNEDKRKFIDQAVAAVTTQQRQQQQQEQQEMMLSTRLTPFSIDNILGRSRDLTPRDHALVSLASNAQLQAGTTRTTGDQGGYADTTRVVTTSTSRSFQTPAHVASSTGEIMTSSNLDELQSFLNSKLRHQHQAAPAALPSPATPHHHHHHYHPHPHQPSHLSQQQTGPGVMPASFYTQFHRHLSILPSSIDGMYVTTLFQ